MRLKKACLEAGHAAHPGQRRARPRRRTPEQVKKLQEYYDTIFTAPLFVVVLVDKQSRYPDYNRFDGPMAVANLMLAARALGYGTVFYTDTISRRRGAPGPADPRALRAGLHHPDRRSQRVAQGPGQEELSEFIVYSPDYSGDH